MNVCMYLSGLDTLFNLFVENKLVDL